MTQVASWLLTAHKTTAFIVTHVSISAVNPDVMSYLPFSIQIPVKSP